VIAVPSGARPGVVHLARPMAPPRHGRHDPRMSTGFGDMQSLLKQAQEMQRRMQDAQRALGERVVEGKAGGGAVQVFVNGNMEVQAVKISKSVVDPDDIDGLEDLVTVAVKQALVAAKELRDREMSKVTGGMNLPGLGF
jgi:DNA-binding YbaB/EbfC family protein